MKPLPPPPPGYYEKFKTKPVTVKPFDAAARDVADRYMGRLAQTLAGLGAELSLRGSTAWGVAGKGDIEIGVYPTDYAWDKVIARLQAAYGPPGNIEANYARFNDTADGTEIEIILLRGYEAEVDRRLSAYLLQHPTLLDEYAQIKRAYAFSRREYQRHKDGFFARVVAMIPEE